MLTRPENPVCLRNLVFLRRRLDRLRHHASLRELMRLLAAYPPSLKELRPYIRFDEAHYVRTVISESPSYRLLAISWLPGQLSPIHDHAGSNCAVRIVRGTAHEARYELAADGLAGPTEVVAYGPGDVLGGQDTDIHMLGNCRLNATGLVTLHLYSPPLDRMNLYRAADAGVIVQP